MDKSLATVTAAEIAKMEDVGEVAKWAKSADAAAIFYAAQDQHENAQKALDISLRLKRRGGEILLPMGEGGRTPRATAGRPLKNSSPPVTNYQQALEDAGISRNTSVEWQKLARMPEAKLEEYLAEAFLWPDNYSIGQALRYAGGFYGRSDSAEWETPQWLFDILNAEFHFQLDVCAQANTAKCKKFFSPEDNGLVQTWAPMRCWMNPPYGGELPGWLAKALAESKKGALVACLVPARVDTNWWWDNALDGEMRFIKGRLVWQEMGTPAPFPSAVVILSPEHQRKVVWWDVQSRKS